MRHSRPTHLKDILLVDEDEQLARAMAYALGKRFGARVTWADGPPAAAARLARDVDLVLADWDITDLGAGGPCAGMRPPLVVLTAFDGASAERERMLGRRFRFWGVVSKEQTLDGMLDNIETICANHEFRLTA